MSNFRIAKDKQGEIILSVYSFHSKKTHHWKLTKEDLHHFIRDISFLLKKETK